MKKKRTISAFLTFVCVFIFVADYILNKTFANIFAAIASLLSILTFFQPTWSKGKRDIPTKNVKENNYRNKISGTILYVLVIVFIIPSLIMLLKCSDNQESETVSNHLTLNKKQTTMYNTQNTIIITNTKSKRHSAQSDIPQKSSIEEEKPNDNNPSVINEHIQHNTLIYFSYQCNIDGKIKYLGDDIEGNLKGKLDKKIDFTNDSSKAYWYVYVKVNVSESNYESISYDVVARIKIEDASGVISTSLESVRRRESEVSAKKAADVVYCSRKRDFRDKIIEEISNYFSNHS